MSVTYKYGYIFENGYYVGGMDQDDDTYYEPAIPMAREDLCQRRKRTRSHPWQKAIITGVSYDNIGKRYRVQFKCKISGSFKDFPTAVRRRAQLEEANGENIRETVEQNEKKGYLLRARRID